MRVSLFASLSTLLAASLAVASPVRRTEVAVPVRRANPDFPDPNQDPFYAIPSNISSYADGAVIRVRPADTSITANVAESYQILYKSLTTSQKPDATVTTVWVPTKLASPAKLLSVQAYEDSVSLNCAPSWAFIKNTNSSNTAVALLDTAIYIEWALSKGYYAVSSDHEGSEAAFINGLQEGMAALDGIRAAKSHLNLPDDTQVVLNGYSGGAHATVWATTLAGSYAPEINIVGATHGGTPIDTRNLFNFLNKGLFSGFAAGGLVGLMNGHPDLNDYVMSVATDDGKALIERYRSPYFCLGNVVLGAPLTDILTFTNATDPLDAPVPTKVLAQESLLMDVNPSPVAVPKFPRLLFHALLDEIVPYSDEQKYVQQQCGKGANIQFQTLAISEHITAEIFGIVGTIIFIQQAFDGTTPKVVCGSGLPDFSDMSSKDAQNIVGPDIIAQIAALNGTKTPLGQVDLP